MIVDWPAADKAALEAELQENVVVVRYDGCSLRVLGGCTLSTPSGYEMRRTTLSRDFLEVTTEDELYARLPLAIASFGGELRRGNHLRLDYGVVGQRNATVESVSADELSGVRCAGATHWVRAVVVGASTLTAQSATSAQGDVSTLIGGGGAGHAASTRVLKMNGNLDDCGREGAAGCEALIQLDLVPIEGVEAVVPSPIVASTAPERGDTGPSPDEEAGVAEGTDAAEETDTVEGTAASSTTSPEATSEGLAPTWFWSTAGLATVAAIGTAVLGTLVITGSSDYEDDPDRSEEDQDTGKRLVLMTDISLGVAVLAAAGAVLLYTQTDFGGEEQPGTLSSNADKFRLGLRGDSTGAALNVGGSF